MDNRITYVTGIFNIGRSEIEGRFRRSFDYYLHYFKKLLQNIPGPLVIYIEAKYEHIVWVYRRKENTKVMTTELSEIRKFPHWDKIQKIRQDENWYSYAAWLKESPQRNLEYYVPLVMSKLFWLKSQSEINFFGSDYFIWVDGGIAHHTDVKYFAENNFNDKLLPYLDKFPVLGFFDNNHKEIHGFRKDALNRFCKHRDANKIVAAAFMGGNKYSIQAIFPYYNQLLQDTLSEGYMGIEENIFTILTYLYPHLFNRIMLRDRGIPFLFFEEINAKFIKRYMLKMANRCPLMLKYIRFIKYRGSMSEIKRTIQKLIMFPVRITHNRNPYINKYICINLERRPDKWAHMQSVSRRLKLNLERFPAIDGEKLTECPDEINPKFTYPRDDSLETLALSRGEWAVTMSHIAIWKRIIQEDAGIYLILEDDAFPDYNFHWLLRKKWQSIPDDWDIVLLGETDGRQDKLKRINSEVYRVNPIIYGYSCSYAYCIRKQSAEKILGYIKRNKASGPIDWFIEILSKEIKIYCFIPPLVMRKDMGSDVWHPSWDFFKK